MTKYTMDYTCGDCLLHSMCGDNICENKDSDHYQHILGDMHPMCDEGEREINCNEGKEVPA